MKSAASFGLYIHIPYCLKKCPYCDFNSYGIGKAGAAQFPELRYVAALQAELLAASRKPEWSGRSCHSIFFGGGTPSLLEPESFRTLLDVMRRTFSFTEPIEITMETNPGTIHEELGVEKLKAIRATGVNRISLGVQSFSERKRQLLGRWHDSTDIVHAIRNVQQAGFTNYSFDFIFGVPDETVEEWIYDLNTALDFSPVHISAYGLTIEPGTDFGRLHARGLFRELDEERQAELYQRTGKLLIAQGYPRYEISNFSRPGFECRHNLGYWRGEDYLALGAGAHAFWGSGETKRRWVNLPGPEHYMAAIERDGGAIQREEVLTPEQEQIEFFFLRLRTANGFFWSEHDARFGDSSRKRYRLTVERLEKEGLLTAVDEQVRLTEKGFLFSNSVFEAFAAAV